MPATLKGIFHNLKESEYTISNSEIVFFFSSKVYRKKYMDEYIENRQRFINRMDKLLDNPPLNMDMLADIALYKRIEKRGFYVWLKGVSISCEELHRYALRKMTEKNTLDWQEMPKPKLDERLKSMGLTYHLK